MFRRAILSLAAVALSSIGSVAHAAPTYIKVGDGGFTFTGGYSGSTTSNAIWSASYKFQAGENGSPAKYGYFTFTGLTPGSTYSLAITWVRDNNRNTQTPWWVLDGGTAAAQIATAVSGTTSGTVNQENPPCGPVDGSGVGSNRVPWYYLGSYTATGTSLTVRIGTGPVELANNDFSVADGARLQDVSETGITCVPQTGTITSTAGWIPRAPNGTTDSIATGPVDMIIDQNLTVGQSSSSFPAIQLPYSKTLTIKDGVTVTAKGDVVMYMTMPTLTSTVRTAGYYPIKVGQGLTGGAVLEFDGSSGTSWRVVASTNSQANSVPKIAGVSGNPAIVRTVNGTSYANFSDGGFANQYGQIEASYCNFTDLGSTTVPTIKTNNVVTGTTVTLTNCNFNNCGDGALGVVWVASSNAGATLTITDCNFENIRTAGYPLALNATASAAVVSSVRRNMFVGFVTYAYTANYASVSLEDNFYLRQFTYGNATSSPVLDRGNFCYKTMTPDSTDKEMTPSGVNYADSYILSDYAEDGQGNPHQFLPGGTNFTVTGCVFDYIGQAGADIGDSVQGNNTTVAVRNCIILKSTHPTTPCAAGALWKFQSASTSTMTIEHNTIYCSNGMLSGYQTGHGSGAGVVNVGPSTKSNIFWTDADSGTGVTAIRNAITYYTTVDMISPGGITNNDIYGPGFGNFATNTINGATNQLIYGMDRMVFSTAPAIQQNAAPNFVAPTRNFLAWARTVRGKSGTDVQVRDAAFVDMKADKTLVRTSLVPWVRAGFAPTNPTLATAAHDGTTVGAMPYQSPVATGLKKIRDALLRRRRGAFNDRTPLKFDVLDERRRNTTRKVA